ncbi:uncharacterized protein N7459_003296 [Penicillium hispanicum]|uniref:uncharacterized protein n=1 Tax=Penicillium hispanicum TaxID=1080232 RepID=UPI002540431F|nr:uncharacterized protein N7459_003296 [Penicillium hispanicum]KAJ5587531.1 hypothetical protein N7459_003296 [Penicillium hispanicum]
MVRVASDASGIVIEGQEVNALFMGPVPRSRRPRRSRLAITNRRYCQFDWSVLELSNRQLAHGWFPPVASAGDQSETATNMNSPLSDAEHPSSPPLQGGSGSETPDEDTRLWESHFPSSQDFVIYEDPSDQETPQPSTPEPLTDPHENQENIFMIPPSSSSDEESETSLFDLRGVQQGIHFLARIDPALAHLNRDDDSDDFNEDIVPNPPRAVHGFRPRMNRITVNRDDMRASWNRNLSPEQASDLRSLSDGLSEDAEQRSNDGHNFRIHEDDDDDYYSDDESTSSNENDSDDIVRDPHYVPEEDESQSTDSIL